MLWKSSRKSTNHSLDPAWSGSGRKSALRLLTTWKLLTKYHNKRDLHWDIANRLDLETSLEEVVEVFWTFFTGAQQWISYWNKRTRDRYIRGGSVNCYGNLDLSFKDFGLHSGTWNLQRNFFQKVYATIDRNSTVLGALKNACVRYRETYYEKKKVFSVQNSLGLYFKTLKPVQHKQKSSEKATLSAESHQVSTDFAQVPTK